MDTVESTTSAYPSVGREETDVDTPDLCIPLDFRFSASYASRYNNCHGSANLPASIPGFIHPDKNELGRKGLGTQLHGIFAEVISSKVDLLEAATFLESLAQVWGKQRTALIKDETKYITWWFLQHKKLPPIENKVIQGLIQYVPKTDTADAHEHSTPPRLIVFMAEALREVQRIIDKFPVRENVMVLVEQKKEAVWLTTAPKTTVDLIIHDEHTMYVIDLKFGDIEIVAAGNEQLLYYAQTWRLPTFKNIVLVILQRNYISEWALSDKYLNEWIIKMQESERAILDGDLALNPGSHCKFCPANPQGRGDKGNKSCPAMLQHLYGERDAEVIEQDVIEEGL